MSLIPRIDRKSSSDDVNQWTYGLGLVIGAAALAVAYAVQYINVDGGVPVHISGPLLIVLFLIGPALAFTQTTEMLYDAFRHALRAAGGVMLVFFIAYYAVGGGQSVDALSSPILTGLTGIMTVAIYAILLFGVCWAIQFFRTGTTGVPDDYQ